LNMTDGPYITGHPGTPQGLQALVDFLPKNRKCIWTANIVGGGLVDLAACVSEATSRRVLAIIPIWSWVHHRTRS